ncbi:MAG: hypothetical protein OXB88_00180 [Bacteriovoracales bacterium]|nr:hypothetical protein [Bacteriovoracales bacterium]
MTKITKSIAALLILFSMGVSKAQGQESCLQKVIGLYRGIRPIDNVDSLVRTFPLSEKSKELLLSYAKEEQRQIFDFFSTVKYPKALPSWTVPFRKRSVKDVVEIVITHKAKPTALFEKALQQYYRMNRPEKRSLHLMLAKKWWFEGTPLIARERGDLAMGPGHLFRLAKPSRWVDLYGHLSPLSTSEFLNDTVSPSPLKKLTRRFPYGEKLHPLMKDHPHAKNLKESVENLKAQKKNDARLLSQNIGKAPTSTEKQRIGRIRNRLREEVAHLNTLQKILAGKEIPTRQWPSYRDVALTLGQQMESLVVLFVSSYALMKTASGIQWLLSHYIARDLDHENIEIDAASAGSALFDDEGFLEYVFESNETEDEESEIEELIRFCNDERNLSLPKCQSLFD